MFNPLNRKLRRLRREKKSAPSILITWNRGLGDIPLGLYALIYRIREFFPLAEITILTRSDLSDGFRLLQDINVVVAPKWERRVPFNLSETLKDYPAKEYDLILENPDPTRWLKWQLGTLTPKLNWQTEKDSLCERFSLPQGCVGVHVQTETHYDYEKNWPLEKWNELFRQLGQRGLPVILFGFKKSPLFENVIDLRGETSLYEMLSIVKNRCASLVVPDSGILSVTYFLNVDFPIRVVSLWSDPRQGVLKQNVPSPNRFYQHFPLIGEKENIASITVNQILEAMLC